MTPEPLIIESELPRPSPGEWYVILFHDMLEPFYITKATNTHVCVTRTDWCSDGGMWLTLNELFNKRQASYIGKGRRTLASYLPLIGNLFPKYTQP
jgi:hypothetical protein